MRQAQFQQPPMQYNQPPNVYYQQHPNQQANLRPTLPVPPQLMNQFSQPPSQPQPQQPRQEGPVPVYIRDGPQQPVYNQQQTYSNDEDYHQGNDQEQGEDGEYGSQEEMEMQNQQIIMFWEHKFYTIFERFQIINDKVDWLRTEFYNLNNELKAVDSEAEWNDAKEHHDDYMEHLEEFSQELAGVMNENASLLEQRDMEGEDSGAWKQRYYELFESFKAMEQELNEVNEGRAPSNIDEEFRENYLLLEREFISVSKELEELKQGGGDSEQMELRKELEYALNEAERFKEMLDQLNEENQEMASDIDELKKTNINLQERIKTGSGGGYTDDDFAQYKHAIQERQYEINQLRGQIEEAEQKINYYNQTQQNNISYNESLEQQLEVKNHENIELSNRLMQWENKYKMIQQTSDEYQKLMKVKSNELQNKEDELHRVRKEVSTANLRRNNSDNEMLKKQFDTRVKKIEEEYEEKIHGLKKKMRQKEEEVENAVLNQIKLESQEKKNKMLLDEIETLSQELQDRERDLLEFKRMSYEFDKLKEIEAQFHAILEQKEQLNTTLLQKNLDIDNLQGQINDFESRIKDLSEKTFATNSKSFIHEIEELNNLIQTKESEVKKIRSSLTIKEAYVIDLETELEKSKNTIVGNEKNFEREKDNLMEVNKSLERKNNDLEKKMRELEYEFGSHMRKNLEDEIKNLRKQNQMRQQNIIRLEGEELELRSRITHFERIRSSHNIDLEELSNRIKELESSKSEMIRKVEISYREIKKREKENKELVENEKNLKEKISALEGNVKENQKLIDEKDKIIGQIEGQLNSTNSKLNYITREHDQLRLRRRDETDLFVKESDDLKRKLFEVEQKSGNGKDGAKVAEFVQIENELVKQLSEEKQFLKAELASALEELGHIPDFKKRQNSNRKSRASEGIDFIQKRLFDFNSKLDKMIIKNKELNDDRNFGNNLENWSNTFNSNKNVAHEEEIKSLKNQLQELRKYCAKLQVEAEGESESARFNPKHEIVFMEQEKNYNDKIDFYQGQINTLENRVESLIQVNTLLKDRVDSLLKGDSSTSAASLYREQLLISEETINSLNQKIRKLQEENRNFKLNNNETTTKMCRQYEDKIFDCENKIFSLERRINNLEMEKSKSDNDKVSFAHNLHINQSELEELQKSSKRNIETLEKDNKELKEQSMKAENEVGQLLSKVRMLESDNKRLTQAINASQQQLFLSPFKNSSYKNSPQALSPSKH